MELAHILRSLGCLFSGFGSLILMSFFIENATTGDLIVNLKYFKNALTQSF
ncbi:hypothetical protein HDEF_1377 [Candidatus Hamiltonella defensa 5AT (Acyrthosiphon pisum)]|uniref:Uncharacterized protein n=1 Tax=Hamiltonella defensa subsp. Acyrthosiphon pisum (strain 5AT) TaxID=572265 RepID=C4K620_HAMD5|nr:hypothetical protein HDEF_1377 [Candidatus Hamiltonella defensa 5AT (Acyrthosiphon pisum)]